MTPPPFIPAINLIVLQLPTPDTEAEEEEYVLFKFCNNYGSGNISAIQQKIVTG